MELGAIVVALNFFAAFPGKKFGKQQNQKNTFSV
jgi:hypothetical protein